MIANLALAGPGAAPGGAQVPACRNPETGKARSLTTIGEDAQFLRAGWKEAHRQRLSASARSAAARSPTRCLRTRSPRSAPVPAHAVRGESPDD